MAAMWRIDWKGTKVGRGRHFLQTIQAEMLTDCVNGDVEEWSSEYTQRESPRIADRSQRES